MIKPVFLLELSFPFLTISLVDTTPRNHSWVYRIDKTWPTCVILLYFIISFNHMCMCMCMCMLYQCIFHWTWPDVFCPIGMAPKWVVTFFLSQFLFQQVSIISPTSCCISGFPWWRAHFVFKVRPCRSNCLWPIQVPLVGVGEWLFVVTHSIKSPCQICHVYSTTS